MCLMIMFMFTFGLNKHSSWAGVFLCPGGGVYGRTCLHEICVSKARGEFTVVHELGHQVHEHINALDHPLDASEAMGARSGLRGGACTHDRPGAPLAFGRGSDR